MELKEVEKTELTLVIYDKKVHFKNTYFFKFCMAK